MRIGYAFIGSAKTATTLLFAIGPGDDGGAGLREARLGRCRSETGSGMKSRQLRPRP
ncbi:hypothetical protein J2X65_003447 [Ancylobacter sp. 3268]|nr:hypothetical protein [Ancylobacter sp. 3268]